MRASDTARRDRMIAIHRDLEQMLITVTSADGLVRVVVGARGDLRDVRLDPNVLRRADGAALAREVVHTAGEAGRRAAAEAGELVRPLTGRRRGEPVDVMFDPPLAELDRCLARPPQSPPMNGMPAAARPDYASYRETLIGERDRLRSASATATSPDGLVTATAGGRGELIGLTLDDRVFRPSDSRRLAGAIVSTARDAAEKVSR
ncbi:YbaB/EbfC family nucleoid-associated protein [Actinoplanes sp. NPDC051470]|uniref:YbaB/EbfC family nucleoid-associated protein n=1 Tax=Actinoplanes sp. NPDC051470 TaxID=3157224 RepID=UPI0034302EA6